MIATAYIALDVIEELLSLGADPNSLNEYGGSALSLAFETENIPAINMLLNQNISKGLQRCFECLAKSNTPIVEEISHFLIESMKLDKGLISSTFYPATQFGNIALLKILVSLSEDISGLNIISQLPDLMTNSVYSDNAEVCKLIHGLAPEGYVFSGKIAELARERGKREIIELFEKNCPDMNTLKKELALKVKNGETDLTEMIPKTEEFDYVDEMEKILALLLHLTMLMKWRRF